MRVFPCLWLIRHPCCGGDCRDLPCSCCSPSCPKPTASSPQGPVATRHNHAVPRRTLHAGSVCCGACVSCWHIAKFFCHAKLGRYRGMADIEQASPLSIWLKLPTSAVALLRSGTVFTSISPRARASEARGSATREATLRCDEPVQLRLWIRIFCRRSRRRARC